MIGHDVKVPEGIDPKESPFALQPAFEGFPFEKDGEEATAIREVIDEEEEDRECARRAEREAANAGC